MLFRNGPDYEERLQRPYVPPQFTLKDIHDAVPKHLLIKNPIRSTLYVLRDVTLTLFLYKFASSITPWVNSDFGGYITGDGQKVFVKSILWMSYWFFQGLVMAGLFCLGHDAGHTSLYNTKIANNAVGFLIHAYLLVPYFAWRSTHHAHHKASASIEREETYVPYTRSEFNLPEEKVATESDYAELLGETPLYTLTRMLTMQLFGWWVYMTKNTMGSKMYPPGTNHFDPDSPLFKPQQRNSIIASDLGIVSMMAILAFLGKNFFLNYYLLPYAWMNHWYGSTLSLITALLMTPGTALSGSVSRLSGFFCSPAETSFGKTVMFTYLQHSDPSIPHYRKTEWTFLRGALSTIDRPLLGWMGRFFLHNISHDHIAHHLFLRAPFYNGPKITAAIKPILQEYYNYDSTPTFYALYRNFTLCTFVEDEGEVVFYKNKEGKASRHLGDTYARTISNSSAASKKKV